ncbi:hypothetical protein PTKIN_Ptkin09bG0163300 [Pterospermum kingtungense]
MKVAVIEEAKNLDTLPLDELIGNLKTFEANLKRRNDEKTLTFIVDHDDTIKKNPTSNEKDLGKILAILTKNLDRAIIRLDKMKYGSRNLSHGKSDKGKKKSSSSQNSIPNDEDNKRDRDAKYFECDGVGHIK